MKREWGQTLRSTEIVRPPGVLTPGGCAGTEIFQYRKVYLPENL